MNQILEPDKEYIISPTPTNNMSSPIRISVQQVTGRTYQYTNEDHPNKPQFRLTREIFHRDWLVLEEL
jgi:hypothetical protein